ncbi:hypothetical protein [Deinococcus sonorensis]|uniref:AAA+ ATPase domain-containing protein n=2 Tax=Deinococcus sonorensis TaxID=309891 RepID=A0AAU7U5K1_9DEIO
MSGTGELSTVQRVLTRLRAVQLRRHGAALAIWGEAGIGKSHAAAAVMRLSGLRSHSFPARTPLTDVALQLPRPKRLGLWAQAQLNLLQRGETPGQDRLRELLGALLSGLAPVVILLEDLHELGPEHSAHVVALARAVTGLRGVAVLATSRHAPPAPFEPYRVAPLEDAPFGVLLESELHGPLPLEASRWLIRRAHGNPLFGLESLRYLARQGHLWNDGQQWRWRPPPEGWLPVTIETLVERLLQEAAPTPLTRSALEALELLPDGPALSQWADVAGRTVTELQAACAPLVEQGVLTPVESQRVTFSHPLYREVTRRTTPGPVRQQLARRAVQGLRATDLLAAAALAPAAGLDADVTLELLTSAAAHAQATGLRGQAGRLLALASDAATGTRQAGLALEAARALLRVDLPEAERLAVRASRDSAHEAEARWVRAEVLATQGRLSEAEALVAAELPAPPDGTGPAPQSLAARQLVLSMLARNIPRVLQLWRSHPELQDSRDVAVLLAGVRAMVNTRALTDARTLLDRLAARTDLGEVDRLTVETQEATLLLQAGELAEAAQRLDHLAPRLLAAGEGRAAAMVRHNQGVALERLSRYQDAVTQELEAARLYAEAGDPRGYAAVRTAAAWNLWHFGRYAEAETLFLEAREVLLSSGHSIMLVECEGMLSLLYLDWSPPLGMELAQRYATSALRTARDIGDLHGAAACLYDLAMVRLRQSRWDDALALTAELQAMCDEHGFQGLVVDAMYGRALALEGLGRAPEALALLRQALQDNSGGSALFTRKIELEVARLSGDVDLARSLLRWFNDRQLHNEVRLLRQAFPDLGCPELGTPVTVERAGPEPVLDVLGAMRVRHGAQVQPVRGGRRRDLLALLLSARLSGRLQVSRLDLLDLLYPGQPDGPAGSSLRDLVHQLRQVCGPGAILTTPDGYALGSIGSDAETFLATGDVRLWRGPAWLGVGLTDPLDASRDALTAALRTRVEALLDLAPGEAERLGRLLVDADPYDLTSLRLLLTALRAGGRHATLNRTYGRARAQLREVGVDLPEAWAPFLSGSVDVFG